ncbi:MAG: aminopeptidase, partial [Chloroflexota bacterium]
MNNFDQNLKKYADVIVQVGLNVQSGQRLTIVPNGMVEETAPLVRAVTRSAYEAGAVLVDVLWTDPELFRARVEAASEDSFGETSHWLYQALLESGERQDAYLGITAANPTAYAGLDQTKIQTIRKAAARKGEAFSKIRSAMGLNWAGVAAAGSGWAKHVFPDEPVESAVEKLWELIFAATRIDQPDPVAAWNTHLEQLAKQKAFLNEKRFDCLHFKGPGTDLKVGLGPDHVWLGGASQTQNGITIVPNLPTEEVFTTPDFRRVSGTVAASMPLNLSGLIIEGMTFRFEEGRIVHFEAEKNGEALERMLDFDEGARQLGEVALVPHSSPISRSGALFYNTLYDENAASHIAIGRAYAIGVQGGDQMSTEALQAAGANHSMI